MTVRVRAAWSVAAALASVAAFPQLLGGRVVDAGWLLAWAVPALWLAALQGLPPRRAALLGGAIGWAAASAILHWIYVVTVRYGHAHPAIGVVAPVGLAVYLAVCGAGFGASQAWLARRGLATAWSAALAWTALDHLRSFALTGFPWATLGYAQHQNPWLLGLASFTGVYGLSFASALGGGALYAFARAAHRRRAPARSAWAAAAAVLALHALGLAAPRAESDESLRVGVVQGDVDQGVKWSAAWVERTLARYEALTRDAAGAGAQLVVWPETAVPGALERDPRLVRRLAELARETRAALVVGGVGVELDVYAQPVAYFDSAFVFDASGRRRDRYDKSHLVPFGEYVPFQDLLGHFFSAVARGIATVGVTQGPAPRALVAALADGRVVRFGVPICYELLFPDLVRGFARDGARVLFGITNDAWYGRTGAPYQFLAITALRSAETGLWLARAANTGVSGFIDATGRVREATPIFEPAWRVADLPLHPDPQHATFYVRHGDAFAWSCWLAWLAHFALGGVRGVRAGRG